MMSDPQESGINDVNEWGKAKFWQFKRFCDSRGFVCSPKQNCLNQSLKLAQNKGKTQENFVSSGQNVHLWNAQQ